MALPLGDGVTHELSVTTEGDCASPAKLATSPADAPLPPLLPTPPPSLHGDEWARLASLVAAADRYSLGHLLSTLKNVSLEHSYKRSYDVSNVASCVVEAPIKRRRMQSVEESFGEGAHFATKVRKQPNGDDDADGSNNEGSTSDKSDDGDDDSDDDDEESPESDESSGYGETPKRRSSLPFRCVFTDCRFSSTFENELTYHLRRVHFAGGNSEIRCPRCSKTFTRLRSLSIHTRSHELFRPFKCVVPGCPSAFTTRSNLRRHLRGHDPEAQALLSTGAPYMCRHCTGARFDSAQARAAHERAEHAAEAGAHNSFVCSYAPCTARFAHKSSLRKHCKRAHGIS